MAETLLDAPAGPGAPSGGGPDFRIWTAGVELVDLAKELGEAPAVNAFPRVRAIGSSTVQDLQGDTMEISALQDMADVEPGLGIFVNHSYIEPEDKVGLLARKPSIKWESGIADALLDIDLLTSINPRAEQLYKGIKAGVRQGTSVGCQVTEYEWRTAKGQVVREEDLSYDDVVNGAVHLFILHVLPVEWSFVGIPANQRSWVLDGAKGLFERTLSPLLAPIVRGAFPRDFKQRVGQIADDRLKKALAEVPARPMGAGDSGRHLLWNAQTKGFVVSGAYGRMTPLSREEVIRMLRNEAPSESIFAGLSGQELTDTIRRVVDVVKADDSDKAAQEARSKKYGIGIKDGGHVTKPGEYADCPEGKFGDPVNFRYPCHTYDNAKAAVSYWGMPKNRKQYSSEEQGIVGGRIRRLARAQGIEVSDDSEEKSMSGSTLSTKARVAIDEDGNHDDFTGAHQHKHAAFGHPSGDEDGMHGHSHEHDGESDHHHEHAGLATGGAAAGAAASKSRKALLVDDDGNHSPFDGTHTHGHKAFGHPSGDDDGLHEHPHDHSGDTVHRHSHDGLEGVGAGAGKTTSARRPGTRKASGDGDNSQLTSTLGGADVGYGGASDVSQGGAGVTSVPNSDTPTDQLGNHPPFVGYHTHAHKAFGAKAGDTEDVHTHEHAHQNDSHHAHPHMDLGHGAGPGYAVTLPSGGLTAPQPGNASPPLGNVGATANPGDKVPTPGYADIGYGGVLPGPGMRPVGTPEAPGASGPDFGANVGYGGSPAGPAMQQNVTQSADSPEFQARLLAYNTLGKYLNFPERAADGRVADKTACALVETQEQAQQVLSIVARLDAYTDGAEACTDELMRMLGVRDIDGVGSGGSDDGAGGDGTPATGATGPYGPKPGKPYYAVEGMTPDMTRVFRRALTTGLLLKEGRRNNANDLATIQGIHDATYALTNGMVCKSTIPAGAQPSDEANDDDALNLDEARGRGNQTVGGTADTFTSRSVRPALLKTMQEFAAVMARFDVKALEAYVSQTKAQADVLIKGMTAIDERLRASEEQIERIGNVRLPRPTSLQRAFTADPAVATLVEMFQATEQGTKNGNGSERLTAIEVEIARLKAQQTTTFYREGIGQMRHWPAGVGAGIRPPLTDDQKVAGMTPASIVSYLEDGEADVPIVGRDD